MKAKIVANTILVLIISAILAIPLASAAPLAEKNNEKFQAFSVVGSFSMGSVFLAEHQYIPSAEQANKLVIQYNENMLAYAVTVNGQTYQLNKDFKYSGHAQWVFFEPVMSGLGYYPTSYRELIQKIDYTYNFSAIPGGIDGTINLQAISNPGGMYINSLSGTGDLQNVQVKAEVTGSSGGSTPPYYILTVNHAGQVSGWPDIPPAV